MPLKTVSRLLKAVSDPTRLKILALLAQRSFCVCELTVALGLSQPTVSRHLQQLEAVGFLISEREGTWVIYRLKPQDPKAQILVDLLLPWVLADPAIQDLIKRALPLDRYECSQKMRESLEKSKGG